MHMYGKIQSIKVNWNNEWTTLKFDFVIIVLFHTSTMMPNTRIDHEFKKKLIGNDYVIIVYNENDYSFDNQHTIEP